MRIRALAVIKTSLTAVKEHLRTQGLELDAVIVSGDITTAHDEAGFTRFSELLMTVAIAESEQIIVVPGNHDVDRDADPRTAEKYASFLKHTRSVGMRTPFCDGVDSFDNSAARPVLELDDCIVAAVNSANWCGTKIASAVGGDHRYDVARVSETQLEFLTDQLRDHVRRRDG